MPISIGAISSAGTPSLTRCPSFKSAAPATTGSDRRKEKRAAASRLKPRNKAAVMVIPERETPGMSARHWARPIIRANFRVIRSIFHRLAPVVSAKARTRPKMIRKPAMSAGLLRKISSRGASRVLPAMAAGMVPARM